MKLIDDTGLSYLIGKIKTMIGVKADKTYVDNKVKTDVPENAKFTDTVTTINGKTGAISKADIVTLGIPAQDTVYEHPTTHSADMIVDGSTNKAFTATEKTKLAGVATGANKYTHPANHPPSIITQDANNRFVTDTEKAAWSGKQNALGYTPVNKAGDTISGQLEVESITFPVVNIARNTSSTGGNLYGGARLQRKTTNPTNGVGIGFYFQAPNSNKTMTHAGMFGGALGTIQAGSEKGEIVFGPSYAGQDPYIRRDLVIRAISASKAEAELNGKLKTDQTLASDPINTVATKKYVDDKVKTDVPADAKFTDTTYDVATASTNGLMSATDKQNVDSNTGGRHTHANSTALNKITEVDGELIYNGETVVTKTVFTWARLKGGMSWGELIGL